MSRARALAPLVLAGLLLAIGLFAGAGTRPSGRGGWALFGPVASAAASVQWVRAHEAFRTGRPARAFDLAEGALALDPGASDGWSLLVDQQLLTLASPLREPDAERRRAWVESALATAERGVAEARAPGRVALSAAIGLLVQAESDEPPAWPGGRAALSALARQWFERARDLGSPEAADFLTGTPLGP